MSTSTTKDLKDILDKRESFFQSENKALKKRYHQLLKENTQLKTLYNMILNKNFNINNNKEI